MSRLGTGGPTGERHRWNTTALSPSDWQWVDDHPFPTDWSFMPRTPTDGFLSPEGEEYLPLPHEQERSDNARFRFTFVCRWCGMRWRYHRYDDGQSESEVRE